MITINRIRLNSQHGPHPAGSIHFIKRIVPHGGHSDDAMQFVIEGDTHVLLSKCTLLAKGDPTC